MMKKTKISPFGIEARICKSTLSKARGLMFSGKKILLFVSNKEEKIPIHMFFVFFPILVLWIDGRKKIAEFKILHPFSMHNPKKKSKYVLEIPLPDTKEGLKRLERITQTGTKLKFEI